METSVEQYPRNPALAAVFERLRSLPTYSINRAPKMGEVKRALCLSGLLCLEGVNKDADDELRDVLTEKLRELRDRYLAKDPDWANAVREGGEIEVDVTMVAIGDMRVTDKKRDSDRSIFREH